MFIFLLFFHKIIIIIRSLPVFVINLSSVRFLKPKNFHTNKKKYVVSLYIVNKWQFDFI